jgi:hypothetical protein
MWGREAWRTMEILCVSPRADTAIQKAAVIKAILLLCPCTLCQQSAHRLLSEVPIADIARGRQQALPWVWRVHNWVNQKLNKPQLQWCKFDKRCRLDYSSITTQHVDTVLSCLSWIAAHPPSFARTDVLGALVEAVADILQTYPSLQAHVEAHLSPRALRSPLRACCRYRTRWLPRASWRQRIYRCPAKR